MHFLLNCLQPHAVMVLFIAIISLIGYGVPGYRVRGEEGGGFAWWLWLLLGILALVSWVMLVAS
jgi:hypothetical protein